MDVKAYRPIPDDDEAIAVRLTAHDSEGALATGTDGMVRWHKTPNKDKTKVWSGSPKITIQGPTERLPPDQILAIRGLLTAATDIAKTLQSNPKALDDEEEQWVISLDA